MRQNCIVQIGLDIVPANGGTTTAIRDFRNALPGEVISFTQPRFLPDPRERGGVLHVPTGPGRLGRAYSWSRSVELRRAERLLRAADLMVVHGLFRYHAQWAHSIAKKNNIPYWVVPHGSLDPYVFTYRRWQKWPWMKMVGIPLMRGAHANIFATAREREKATSHTHRCSAVVVPWPISSFDLVAGAANKQSVRTRLGIPEESKVLLFLGRLHPAKRVLETIDALAASGDERIHLLVVGPDSGELPLAVCVQRAASLACEQRVHFIGPAFGPEKQEIFAAADALVNLSHKENFGYTVAEALAGGLPVILSPGNDLAPELERIGCGWFLRTFEAMEAARSFQSFANSDASVLREMGSRGQSWVHRELVPGRFSERLTTLAEEAIRSRSP